MTDGKILYKKTLESRVLNYKLNSPINLSPNENSYMDISHILNFADRNFAISGVKRDVRSNSYQNALFA